MSKNITAVEWLQEQLKKGVDFNPLDKNSYLNNVEKLFQQAKEMEKQQLYKFYVQVGIDCITQADRTVEDYYISTFKSE